MLLDNNPSLSPVWGVTEALTQPLPVTLPPPVVVVLGVWLLGESVNENFAGVGDVWCSPVLP